MIPTETISDKHQMIAGQVILGFRMNHNGADKKIKSGDIIPIKEAWANFWGNLANDKKKLFTSLPNFDAGKFEQITGIEL